MSWRPHGRARVDARNPSAWGVCDRCYLTYNLKDLRWQFQWQGAQLVNLGILVCDTCYDDPQPQLRSLTLPPDPRPVFNPRPEYYAIDETNWLVTQTRNILTTQSGIRLITQAVNPDS